MNFYTYGFGVSDQKFDIFAEILEHLPDARRKLLGAKGDTYLAELASLVRAIIDYSPSS